MSIESNKTLVRDLIEKVWNAHRPDLIGQFYTADVVVHAGPQGDLDLARSKDFAAMAFKAFPDFNVKIEDVIAEGDRVVQRQTFSGTHKGEFQGIPATGKHVTMSMIYIMRIKDGKIAEVWGGGDSMVMMQQLGLMSTPEATR